MYGSYGWYIARLLDRSVRWKAPEGTLKGFNQSEYREELVALHGYKCQEGEQHPTVR